MTFLNQSEDLSDKLRVKGYPKHNIRQAKKQALHTQRESLLETNAKPAATNLACVTTFTPISNQIKKIIKKQWNILNSNTLNLERPLFSFKQICNLRQLLVHTRPQQKQLTPPPPRTVTGLPPIAGNFPCGKCSVCKFTKSTKTINLPNGKIWTQSLHTNCNTSMCIYLISCPCRKYYVGMTTRPVKTRIMKHRSTIRCGRTATKLTNHFLEYKHHEDQIEWTILETVQNECQLFQKEQRWVFSLNMANTRLNENIPWSSLLQK